MPLPCIRQNDNLIYGALTNAAIAYGTGAISVGTPIPSFFGFNVSSNTLQYHVKGLACHDKLEKRITESRRTMKATICLDDTGINLVKNVLISVFMIMQKTSCNTNFNEMAVQLHSGCK